MLLNSFEFKKIIKDRKVIIFDLDGTLIDSIEIWDKADQDVIYFYTGKVVNLDIIRRDRDYILTTTKNPEIYLAYAEYLIDNYKLGITLDELSEKRYEITTKAIRNDVKFKDNAISFLNKLKSLNYLLVLATTTGRGSIDIYNKENINTKIIDFDLMFDLILTKESVKKKKPDPEIYLKVIEKLGVKASECLIFEDTLHGIEAGHKAGIEVVAINNKYDPEAIKKAEYYINNFNEVLW